SGRSPTASPGCRRITITKRERPPQRGTCRENAKLFEKVSVLARNLLAIQDLPRNPGLVVSAPTSREVPLPSRPPSSRGLPNQYERGSRAPGEAHGCSARGEPPT